MDLSAVAGSPAFATLQAFAATAGPSAPTQAAAEDAQPASTTPRVGAGAGLYGASQSIGHALSAADAASSAGQSVLGLLGQMRQAAAQASGTDLATAARQALDQTFQTAAAQIPPTLRSATVDGVNLVDGSASGVLKAPLGDGAQASLDAIDLSLDGPILALNGATLVTPQAASAAQASVHAAVQAATGSLDGLQSQADTLASHAVHLQSLGQAVASSSSDGGSDGVRLLALQVAQQLSGQSASIANAAPQQVLALFR